MTLDRYMRYCTLQGYFFVSGVFIYKVRPPFEPRQAVRDVCRVERTREEDAAG